MLAQFKDKIWAFLCLMMSVSEQSWEITSSPSLQSPTAWPGPAVLVGWAPSLLARLVCASWEDGQVFSGFPELGHNGTSFK